MCFHACLVSDHVAACKWVAIFGSSGVLFLILCSTPPSPSPFPASFLSHFACHVLFSSMLTLFLLIFVCVGNDTVAVTVRRTSSCLLRPKYQQGVPAYLCPIWIQRWNCLNFCTISKPYTHEGWWMTVIFMERNCISKGIYFFNTEISKQMQSLFPDM